MSTYEVCLRCNRSWSRADEHISIVDDIPISHGLPRDYCPHCNPAWPTINQWVVADIQASSSPKTIALAERIKAAGAQWIMIDGETWYRKP